MELTRTEIDGIMMEPHELTRCAKCGTVSHKDGFCTCESCGAAYCHTTSCAQELSFDIGSFCLECERKARTDQAWEAYDRADFLSWYRRQ